VHGKIAAVGFAKVAQWRGRGDAERGSRRRASLRTSVFIGEGHSGDGLPARNGFQSSRSSLALSTAR
jgi:hypothetical protein